MRRAADGPRRAPPLALVARQPHAVRLETRRRLEDRRILAPARAQEVLVRAEHAPARRLQRRRRQHVAQELHEDLVVVRAIELEARHERRPLELQRQQQVLEEALVVEMPVLGRLRDHQPPREVLPPQVEPRRRPDVRLDPARRERRDERRHVHSDVLVPRRAVEEPAVIREDRQRNGHRVSARPVRAASPRVPYPRAIGGEPTSIRGRRAYRGTRFAPRRFAPAAAGSSDEAGGEPAPRRRRRSAFSGKESR